MKSVQLKTKAESLKVLLVGNNPIEMGPVLEKLKQLRNQKVTTEIAFDMKSIEERLSTFLPDFILIDDNIGRKELSEMVIKLSANRKTKSIPITVLKNSNYHESFASSSILDYLLKQNLSAEALYNTVRNTLRFRRTQQFLYSAYQKRKGVLMKMSENLFKSGQLKQIPS